MGSVKPRINMTTKEPSRKQVIISMSSNSSEVIGNFVNIHIANINKCLKKAKSDTIADFIWVESKDIIITTNKAASALDIKIIEKYLKENNNIDLDYITSPCLPKSKSYLKILGLLYIVEKNNLSVTSELIKEVIKESYIFNNIILTLRP